MGKKPYLTDEEIIKNVTTSHREYTRNNLFSMTLSIYLLEFSGEPSRNNHSKLKTLAAMLSTCVNIKTGAIILSHSLRYGRPMISPTKYEKKTHTHLMDSLRKRRNLQKQYEQQRVSFSTTIENGVMITESIKERDPVCLISFKSNNKNHRRLKYIDETTSKVKTQ